MENRPSENDVTKSAVGNRLRAVRLACGYSTSKEFASVLGLSAQRFSQYEVGKTYPGPEVLKTVSCLTGATSDFVLFGRVAGLPHELVVRMGLTDRDAKSLSKGVILK